MTQSSDQKPTAAPEPEAKSKQPISTELSPKELNQVSGGLSIMKTVDKSSAKLHIG